jgi:hypothetical protein
MKKEQRQNRTGRQNMNSDIYSMNWNNMDKKRPENYDALIIPAIEKLTQYMPGDIIKNKIYNYIIYYYSKGRTTGLLDSIYIRRSDGSTGRIYYNITQDNITLELIREG